MCGLTHEDWMIMRGALEDVYAPDRARVIMGMVRGHETDVEMMEYHRRWAEFGDPPAETVRQCLQGEVHGYSQNLLYPKNRRNGWVTHNKYHMPDMVWAYASQGYIDRVRGEVEEMRAAKRG